MKVIKEIIQKLNIKYIFGMMIIISVLWILFDTKNIIPQIMLIVSLSYFVNCLVDFIFKYISNKAKILRVRRRIKKYLIKEISDDEKEFLVKYYYDVTNNKFNKTSNYIPFRDCNVVLLEFNNIIGRASYLAEGGVYVPYFIQPITYKIINKDKIKNSLIHYNSNDKNKTEV